WHELGHAQAHRKFGGFAEIHLYSMGGLCVGRGRNSYTRQESMWISAAGPGASIFLFGIALAIHWFTPIGERSDLGRLLILDLLFINGFWTAVNLLPVLPLDGGQIFQAFMANKNPRLPVQVGMVVAILVAILAFSIGQWPMAIFFGYLAHSNWERGQGTHHGFW
ncbi:MAG: hypothetical protein KDM63_13210, partial [Verrucomicrobiae bacterium]|nr:hypothetical protein [Verrucomicrobiae bacterium]